MFLFVLLLSFLLSALLVRYVVERIRLGRISRARGCRPPKNWSIVKEPILGLDFILDSLRNAKAGRYLHFSHERFCRYGTTYVTQRLLFHTIHTADPENIKAMLATDFDSFRLADVRINAMTPIFGAGIFTTNGAAWAHSRAILRPCFTRQNMTPLLTMVERHFQDLIKLIPTDGSTFDLQKLFFSLTMDTATEFLMGHSTNTLDPTKNTEAERNFVEDYLAGCFLAVRKIQLGPLQRFSFDRAANKSRDRALAYVDRFVDEALSEKSSGKFDDDRDDADTAEYNFLRVMARDTTDRTLLRDQILNVLLASRDTTASLMSNLFYVLARNPAIYAKLRKEVLAGVQGDLPTETELVNMRYLRWCINESLRLHTVVPGNTREAACDTILPVGGGHDGRSPIFVKKGTCVLYNPYAMHRREDIFGPEPDKFNPERWDGLRPGWGFLPFNGGPRICLGQQFALTEASYVIVRMVQSFEAIENRDSLPWREQYSLVLTSKHGVQVSATPATLHSGMRAGD